MTPLALLLALGACTLEPSDASTHNVVIRLTPGADVADPPSGTLPVIEAGSSVAPVLDAPDRALGRLGFTGTLQATVSQGVHHVYVMGNLDSHPGCEEPEEPQSSCSPSGWIGDTLVEVFGPDWGPDDAETDSPVVEIPEGEIVEVALTVRPSCECDD
ncbi:MAG: hypothetical protein V4850_12980 [Myxococcota bacterium]